MSQSEVSFRPATEGDLEMMMAWRSNPLLYENFYIQDEPLDWETHLDWWNSRKNRRDWIIVIRDSDRWRDVGTVSLSDLSTDVPEIGVYIGEIPLWGEGLGSKAVSYCLEWLHERGYESVRARILNDNDASIRMFEGMGFEHVGNAREDESEYRFDIKKKR